ncbi:hypothetical protein [Micromonospora sp. NPDC051006]|uniref:hypothetical protein n=1 Tax=Micromonospora sp. NPDC051006 TaxID=3364283 RepID=UPI0037A6B515
MKFSFEVGVEERHQVTFSFDKVWGGLSITVDGQPVHRELRVLSVELVKRYQFTVGVQERHDVLIEKERKLMFAGFRPQQYRAYVDGQLVAEHTG